jgi:hypothetical protein
VEFTKKGNQYVGRTARDSRLRHSVRTVFGDWAFKYQPLAEVFRLMRTASGAYQGEVLDSPPLCTPGECGEGRWYATRMTVEGDVAKEHYKQGGRHMRVYWVRWPPRHQSPVSR